MPGELLRRGHDCGDEASGLGLKKDDVWRCDCGKTWKVKERANGDLYLSFVLMPWRYE